MVSSELFDPRRKSDALITDLLITDYYCVVAATPRSSAISLTR